MHRRMLWLAALTLAACSVDETHPRCQTDAECETAEECYLGYCVLVQDAAARESAQRAAGEGRRDTDGGAHDAGMEGCPPREQDAGPDEGGCCEGPVRCYDGPDGTAGVGRCQAGMRACRDRELGSCTGSVLPRAEACDNEGSDDDCDGKTDNVRGRGEACTLEGVAAMCGGGMRDCSNGKLQCVAKQAPPAETCNQKDDDCDGKTDETFNLSNDVANCGSCGRACGIAQLCCSGACAARRTDTPNGCACGPDNACPAGQTCCNGGCKNLQSDRTSCGACGRSCGAQEQCCAGTCVDSRSDIMNCGRCGVSCTRGSKPTCCSGFCSDLTTDEGNCGGCGNVCALLCSCQPQSGAGVCVSLLGGSCN